MNSFKTHIPLLSAIPKLLTIKRVIEFGPGIFSTGLFLNKKVYTKLNKLISLESIEEWYETIKNKFHDKRLAMFLDSEENLLTMSKHYAPVDMVFVDGKREDMRVPTILDSKTITEIVVAHDMESKKYKDGLDFKYVYIYKKYKPYTAIMSDTININKIKDFL